MILFPLDKFIISTNLRKNEVVKRLERQIAPVFSYMIQVKSTDKPFKGKVSDNGFEMMRVVSGRNSWLPFIKGQIELTSEGSLIQISLSWHWIINLFMAMIMGSSLLLGISLALSDFRSSRFQWTDLIPWGFLFFTYIFAMVTFDEEQRYVKVFLNKLFSEDGYRDLPKFDEDWN